MKWSVHYVQHPYWRAQNGACLYGAVIIAGHVKPFFSPSRSRWSGHQNKKHLGDSSGQIKVIPLEPSLCFDLFSIRRRYVSFKKLHLFTTYGRALCPPQRLRHEGVAILAIGKDKSRSEYRTLVPYVNYVPRIDRQRSMSLASCD
jgi:hypothetical protein